MRALVATTLLSVALLAQSACGSSESMRIGIQQWQDVVVVVESRPSPPSAGMVEFIVIATRKGTHPVNDMVVTLSIPGVEPRQAIQDGFTGVFRRALAVRDPAKDVLAVQLRRKGEEHTLYFPLLISKETP